MRRRAYCNAPTARLKGQCGSVTCQRRRDENDSVAIGSFRPAEPYCYCARARRLQPRTGVGDLREVKVLASQVLLRETFEPSSCNLAEFDS
jgi:hypothetical protein